MHFIGVDLGQRVDYTAIAVVERIEPVVCGFDHLHWMRTEERLPDEWVVRRLERVPLGTAYTRVVARLAELAQHPRLRGDCEMVVDATGVGAPVIDMLQAERVECKVTPVVLTAGANENFDGKAWRTPKMDVLARLQMLIEQRRLRVSRKVREAAALKRELLDVKAKQKPGGRMRIGADAAGQHDDLVMAVALGVWMRGGRKKAGLMGKRVL